HIQPETLNNSEKLVAQKKDQLPNELDQLREYQAFFPTPVRNTRDLFEVAYRITPMIGIAQVCFMDAVQKLGALHASITVLCILERLTTIDNPGGYLRQLAKEGQGGRFCLSRLVRETLRMRKLSADNRNTVLNTMA
ncbi:MAG: replication initiation protein RepC, partial [Pseudomonadota bacterium]